MPKLVKSVEHIIKHREIVDNTWSNLQFEDGESFTAEAIGSDNTLIEFKDWLANKSDLESKSNIGVIIQPDDDFEAEIENLLSLPVIAVNFPVFTDGRGYSIARLLRQRYGFKNEIRAIGDVFHDVLFYLAACGVTAFEINSGVDLEKALDGFSTFKEQYQTNVNQTVPLYRRRA